MAQNRRTLANHYPTQCDIDCGHLPGRHPSGCLFRHAPLLCGGSGNDIARIFALCSAVVLDWDASNCLFMWWRFLRSLSAWRRDLSRVRVELVLLAAPGGSCLAPLPAGASPVLWGLRGPVALYAQ